MKSLRLHRESRADVTALSNAFIDEYMISANGEYVKLYIYLLRCISDEKKELSLSSIADTFDYTEKDVKRALKYWAKAKLIRLEINDSRELTGIQFLDVPVTAVPVPAEKTTAAPTAEPTQAETPEDKPAKELLPKKAPTSAISAKIQTLSPNRLKRLREKKDIKQLFFIAEQYMGKTLSSSDVNSILYFYDELKFSAELIEYLIEYCVSKGHKSMHYINSVALAWAESAITSVTDAKEYTNLYHKNCFSVLKAFGITNRYPAAAEAKYITKWLDDYGFTLDIVLEACNRTVLSINKPDFKYANSILENWRRSGVKHLKDVKEVDARHIASEKARESASVKKPESSNRFNNFEARDYDYESLEKELIKAN